TCLSWAAASFRQALRQIQHRRLPPCHCARQKRSRWSLVADCFLKSKKGYDEIVNGILRAKQFWPKGRSVTECCIGRTHVSRQEIVCLRGRRRALCISESSMPYGMEIALTLIVATYWFVGSFYEGCMTKRPKRSKARPGKSPSSRFAFPFFTTTPTEQRQIDAKTGTRRMSEFAIAKLGPIPPPSRVPVMDLSEIIGQPGADEIKAVGAIRFHA